MKKLSILELNRMQLTDYREADKVPFVVVLDNVRSLHNVGSVFRTSDAYRVERIVLCGVDAIGTIEDAAQIGEALRVLEVVGVQLVELLTEAGIRLAGLGDLVRLVCALASLDFEGDFLFGESRYREVLKNPGVWIRGGCNDERRTRKVDHLVRRGACAVLLSRLLLCGFFASFLLLGAHGATGACGEQARGGSAENGGNELLSSYHTCLSFAIDRTIIA